MHMMSKKLRRSRIGITFAGMTAGLLAIAFSLTPSAQATTTPHTDDHTSTVRVVSPSSPEAFMHTAVRRCTPAPKNVRRACWSLYLRPAFRDIPSGRDIVAECFGAAKAEAHDYPGPRTWSEYLRGCILGNIETP